MAALLHLKMDIDIEKAGAMLHKEFAQKVINLPGLKFKIWGYDEKKKEYSGFYIYETRRDAEIRARSATAFLMKMFPGVTNATAQIYDINEELSKITRTPFDIQSNPSYPEVEDLDMLSDFNLSKRH